MAGFLIPLYADAISAYHASPPGLGILRSFLLLIETFSTKVVMLTANHKWRVKVRRLAFTFLTSILLATKTRKNYFP